MRRLILIAAGLVALLSSACAAGNAPVSSYPAATALAGGELVYCIQSATSKKCTVIQLATYVFGQVSGDVTCTSGGVCTVTKTNGVAFGALATAVPATGIATFLTTPSSANLAAALTDKTGTGTAVFGSAPTIAAPVFGTSATFAYAASAGTQCAQLSSAGALTGTGSACGGSGSSGANPTATAGPTAVNGVSTSFMRADGAPAIQLGTAAQKGIVQVDGSTITATGGVISAIAGGSGTVTSVSAGCGLSTGGSAITTTGTVSANAVINAQVGTTYTVLSTDCGKVITLTNAASIAVTIPIASAVGFGSTFYTTFINEGAGVVTLTPTTSQIDGAASLTLAQGQSVDLITDGTNYFTMRGRPTGGSANTIASGTAALGTSAISSAACATVVTTAATGVATTDVVTASFNGDPTAVTGYTPVTTGALTIFSYPTANNVNFKVCNLTSSSVTPGAITLNWRVVR